MPARAPSATSADSLRRMKAQRQHDTVPELRLRSELHRRGLRFRVNYRLPDSRRRADIVFPRLKLAVFVDGCFWHSCPEHGTWPNDNATWWRGKLAANVRRDEETNSALGELGWSVLRVWEHEPVLDAAARVEKRVAALRRLTHDRR